MDAASLTTHPLTRYVPLRDSILGLTLVVLPGAGFVAGLAFVSGQGRLPQIWEPSTHPWQLWVIGVFGIAATAAGLLDWHFHATGQRIVGSKERRGELVALGFGGAPLFGLMMAASVSDRPVAWLLPIILVFTFTTVMICFDEFVFHRKACSRYETTLHRTLVLGNGTAWAAWMHWIFLSA